MLTYIFLHTWGRLGSKEIFLLLCCFVLWIKETGLQRDLILASQVSNKQGEPFRKFLHQQGLSSEALRGTRIQAQPIVCRGKIPLPGPPLNSGGRRETNEQRVLCSWRCWREKQMYDGRLPNTLESQRRLPLTQLSQASTDTWVCQASEWGWVRDEMLDWAHKTLGDLEVTPALRL